MGDGRGQILIYVLVCLALTGAAVWLTRWGFCVGAAVLFFGFGLGTASVVAGRRQFREIDETDRRHGAPEPLAAAREGETMTLSGTVTSPDEVTSPATGERFALVLVDCVRASGVGQIDATVLARVLGSELHVAEDDAEATIDTERVHLSGRVHGNTRWTGWGFAKVPDESLRGWLREHDADVSDPGREGEGANFEYREIVLHEGDPVIVSGEVLSVERGRAADGYRGARPVTRARIGGERVAIRWFSPEAREASERRAWRLSVGGGALIVWAVATFVLALSRA